MSKPEFVYVTYIETTPDRLWQALTSSEFSKAYWFGTELRSDWRVGSPFALVSEGTATDVGEILEFDPPHRLSYTFQHVLREEFRNERPTKVVFQPWLFTHLIRGWPCDWPGMMFHQVRAKQVVSNNLKRAESAS